MPVPKTIAKTVDVVVNPFHVLYIDGKGHYEGETVTLPKDEATPLIESARVRPA